MIVKLFCAILLLMIATPLSVSIFYEEYGFALIFLLGWVYVPYENRDRFKSEEEKKEVIDSSKGDQ